MLGNIGDISLNGATFTADWYSTLAFALVSYCTSEWYVIVRVIAIFIRHRDVVNDEQVQDVVSVHKDNLTSSRCVEPFPQPVLGLFGDLAPRNYDRVVDEPLLVDIRISLTVCLRNSVMLAANVALAFERPSCL